MSIPRMIWMIHYYLVELIFMCTIYLEFIWRTIILTKIFLWSNWHTACPFNFENIFFIHATHLTELCYMSSLIPKTWILQNQPGFFYIFQGVYILESFSSKYRIWIVFVSIMQNIERIRMQNIQEEGWLRIIFLQQHFWDLWIKIW